jgi:hypothetical protein
VQTLTVTYSRPVTIQTVRFIEGGHYPSGSLTRQGGWFDSLKVELRVGTQWLSPAAAGAGAVTLPTPLDPAVPGQIIDFQFQNPVQATGVRIFGPAGGVDAFVTCCELDALAPLPARPVAFDLTGDDAANVEDLYKAHAQPVDLDADGAADTDDLDYLEARLRWMEWQDTTAR